jgi:hypothetical protein
LRRGFPGSLVADHLRALWPEWSGALDGLDLDAAVQDVPTAELQRAAPRSRRGNYGERKP